ncbi:MAG: ABC transporter ATP-binding protein [Chloroflexota bacterium]
MSEIELVNVSVSYSSPPKDPRSWLFPQRKELLQEDLPVIDSGKILALDQVNLVIPDGQTYAILGPSGCGKSTLLRVVAGIIDNYSGKITYDGNEIDQVPTKDRFIGMVFQNFALYPNFDGKGNLSFFFKLHKINDQETTDRIRFTSELMGIDFQDLLPRRPGTLSGGQKQRVAIGRAIVRAPRLFLLDEPLSNLDAKLRVQTRTEIKRLLHLFGITSIYVTHDQVEAIALADKIVIMRAGKIEQVGSYQELMAKPVNSFVAGFLGLPPMNLFYGGIVTGQVYNFNNVSFVIPEQIVLLFNLNRPVILGIRPEALHVVIGEIESGNISFMGSIESIETDFAMHRQIVYLRTGAWLYSATCSSDQKLNVGDVVSVETDLSMVYFFDEQTGLRF